MKLIINSAVFVIFIVFFSSLNYPYLSTSITFVNPNLNWCYAFRLYHLYCLELYSSNPFRIDLSIDFKLLNHQQRPKLNIKRLELFLRNKSIFP